MGLALITQPMYRFISVLTMPLPIPRPKHEALGSSKDDVYRHSSRRSD
jgi:hypothetical protein